MSFKRQLCDVVYTLAQVVAAAVKGRKSVYWKRRKTQKTCFIYKASQKANNNIYKCYQTDNELL